MIEWVKYGGVQGVDGGRRVKYEPLKGKVYHIPEKGINIFLYSNVKSAVQGLIRELEQEVSKEEDTVLDKSYVIHRIVIPKIKEWFPDIVEGENEQPKLEKT